jgi:small-conductance mechanosensitive channel
MELPVFGDLMPMLKTIGRLAAMIVSFLVIHLVVYRLMKKYAHRHNQLQFEYLLKKTFHSTRYFIIFLSLLISFGVSGIQEKVPRLYDILVILFIINISWVFAAFMSFGFGIIQGRYNLASTDNLEARKRMTQLKVLERLMVTLIITVGFASALLTIDEIKAIGVNLLASAGIAGIIIGFAAQKSLGLVFAGFQIAFTQPIRIDDVLVVEGEWGRVEEITLTYVVIRIWDERRLIVPVNYFLENSFQNWTRSSSNVMGSVFIYADYRFPVDILRPELDRLLAGNKNWDGRVKNVQVTDTTEYSIKIRILASSSDSSKNWDLRVFLRENLVAFIREKYPEYLPVTRIEMFPPDKK